MNYIIFITLIFAVAVFAQETSILRDIFLLDCTGTVHFFPDPEDTIAAVNGFQMGPLYTYAIESMLERVDCVCPDADRNEVLSLIPGTVDWYFNVLSENPVTQITGCPGVLENFAAQASTFTFPGTCDWKNDRECLFQADFGLGVIFDVAILECPDSHLPLMSLGCSGPACDRLFMPCIEDTECGESLVCNQVLDFEDTPIPTAQNIADFFEALLLSEGNCLDERDFWISLINFVRLEFYDNSDDLTIFRPKYCLPEILNEAHQEDLGPILFNATNYLECDIQHEVYYNCRPDSLCSYTSEGCEYLTVETPEECEPRYRCADYDYVDGVCLEIDCAEYDIYPNNDTCKTPYCQNPTFDDFGNLNYTLCSDYSLYQRIKSIDCFKNGNGPLLAWDGDKEGLGLGNVHDWVTESPFFVPPRALSPLTEGAIPLFRSDCDATIQYLPNSPIGVSVAFPRFINIYNWVYETLRERFDCEVPAEDNDIMFNVQNMLTTFAFLPTANLETFESFRDFPLDTFTSYFFSNDWNITLPDGSTTGAYFFEFPETCNWETWTTEGVCTFTYQGLSSLISLDLTFNVRLDQCENDFPALYVECVGEDCNLLKGIVECTPEDAGSCANAECWTIEESLLQIWPKDYDDSGQPIATELYDIIAELTGVYSDECFSNNNDQLIKDYNNVLIMMGLDESATHVCLPDFSSAIDTEYDWLSTQWFLNSEDRIVLTDLLAWEAPEFVDEVTEDTATGFSALFVPSIIAFLGFCLL